MCSNRPSVFFALTFLVICGCVEPDPSVHECVPDCDGKECGGDGCGGHCGFAPGPQHHCDLDTWTWVCDPDCEGKECGDDGCGGQCAWKCIDGEVCFEFACCTPKCLGKQCGDDGCGGTCGDCECGETCAGWYCEFTACDGRECDPDGCGGSCGSCEGVDQVCTEEGLCCTPNCIGKECGDDGCGGGCGACPPDEPICAGGICVLTCIPDCEGKECGDDGCGGSCGECPPDEPTCAAGICVLTGIPDCEGKECGDDGCGGSCGECGCGEICNQTGVCAFVACTGKECGDDGCGGSCGECPPETPLCVDGTCEEECTPDCIVKECGDDSCGGSCGECGCGEICNQTGVCAFVACTGKECGDDGCGGSCGECPPETPLCVDGTCEEECMPNCIGKDCGDDGCGGSCGTCTGAQEECVNGQCDCVPECIVKECGDDGCGESCGACDADLEECVQVTTGDWFCVAQLVEIFAESFWMGCNNCAGSTVNDSSCDVDEHPYHEVYLDAYEIDKTEVTTDQYAACVSASGCTSAGTWGICTYQHAGLGDHPINCVTWDQAKAYCLWAGKELCTEAQWEKGARGCCDENGGASNCKAQSRMFPWGNEPPTCDLAVKSGCDGGDTHNVCSLSPAGDSPYGLCDMAGNVWEWVADWYGSDYYCAGLGADTSSPWTYCMECDSWWGSPEAWSNPPGPESGLYRVLRGGSFGNSGGGLRVSSRNFGSPSDDYDFLGFRCAKSE